jgi:4-amino-4-deoxy-L-arabinose transferase-like glycosyltransferase
MRAGSSPRRLRLAPALLLIWLLALVLALMGLGDQPLRDWDEGIVARVALELSQAPRSEKLLPTFWGDPYLNKPPAIHLLIAAVIGLWRAVAQAPAEALPPEWVVRLGPALLSACLPPLLALVQLRLRPAERGTALATAALALTLMPLARHGRLAMLDGALLVAMALQWWAVLGLDQRLDQRFKQRPSQNLVLALVAGLATSLLLLLKAPAALPLLLAVLALRWFEPDQPQLPCWPLLLGLALGLLPGLGWHGLHLMARGPDALAMWTSQGFARVGGSLEGHSGGPIPPLLELLKGGWPWLPLWPFGLALAWRQRRLRAGHWCLGLTVLTTLLVLPLRTQLPWYSLLLWPPFCLVCAPVLAWLIRSGPEDRPPAAAQAAAIPWFWCGLGLLLLLAYPVATLGILPLPPATRPLLLSLGVALLAGGGLLLTHGQAGRRAGGLLLVGGVWLTLALLLSGPLWLWELNESWPVGPVAALARRQPVGANAPPLLFWREAERPSLNWYAGRRVRGSAGLEDLPPSAQGERLLLSRARPDDGDLRCVPIKPAGEFHLYRCLR